MPKRKRSHEPSLEEKLTQWHKELARGMKTTKGFERQRLSKRIREAQTDSDKTARLEREVAVLKSLDLQQAAHAHLCSSLLKIKGIAESPRLPSDIVRPIPKPEGLSEEEKAALHNVTSALCNRKQIRDVVEEAIMGTCIALRVPMPEKMKKGGKGKKEKKDSRAEKEEQADDRDSGATIRKAGKKDVEEEEEEEEEDDGEQSDLDQEPELVLLKRKRETIADEDQDLESDENEEDGPSDGQEFEGFSDSDAEERAWSRYDIFVAGSSSDEDESDEDGASEDELAVDSKARSLRRAPTADDISISSAESSEPEEEDLDISESDGSDSESASIPPSKKAKTTKTAKNGPVSAGNSAFLPTLMGGYISGSESEASDLDLEPARKNRRGQRARQAIWEKKYKEKAKHLQNQQNAKGRDQGWDMRRGAVGDDDGSNKPWKKGIHNPFDNKHIHPERQQHLQGRDRERNYNSQVREEKPKPKAPPKRDDTGPLHPSWAAAKKAKEEGQKVAFQGRKVVFD
ncbi:Bud-site selection protein [Hypoxylon trugodes]|uniref:Bud-site selection protein n=1 Tax=Hypoxylon trugodes TaxID=326681 RepID=UPI00219B4659|nr:Bud-site selection protein [Hypoxylon trugodes]KAI1387703.1 Bud-site selection protein [Hypoxylon trugodes]